MYTSVFTYIFTYLGCKKFFSISGEIRYLPQTTKLMTYQLEYIYWKTLIIKKSRKITNIYINDICLDPLYMYRTRAMFCGLFLSRSLSISSNFIECSSKITQKLMENTCIFLIFNKTKCSLEISDFGKCLQYLQLLYHKFALYAQPLFF